MDRKATRASKSTPEEMALATADLDSLNKVVTMLNEQYIGDTKCDGEMAWACVSCRAVNLRTQIRSFAHELADLYGIDDELVS